MRSFLKRHLPDRDKLKNHKRLQVFGDLIHDPNIWHLTRRSSAGGVATGLFCCFIPLPVHMLTASALSILLRVNLPLAVIFTWVTNPITIAPIFLFCYKLGAAILGVRMHHVNFELSFSYLLEKLALIWEPLLLGCFIMATISATVGYISVRLIWRMSAISKWEERKRNRLSGN